MNLLFNIFVILIILAALGDYSNGARYRSGTRTSSRSRTSSTSIRSYRGPTYMSGSWKTAAAVGTVFGLMSYQQRRIYRRYPNREPKVCFNEKNLRNGTYGYFICPEEDQRDDWAYCCGSSDEQRCCTYTDKSAEGRIGGIVVGVIIVCIITGIVVFCFCKRRRQNQHAKGGIILDANKGKPIPEQRPLTQNYNPDGAGIQMHTYNTQPGMVAPNTYDATTPGLPYSQNPGMAPPQPYGVGDPGMAPSQPYGVGDPGMAPPQPYGPGPYAHNQGVPGVQPGSYPPPPAPTPYPPPADGPTPYPPPTGGTTPLQTIAAPPEPGFIAQGPYTGSEPSQPPIGFSDEKHPLPEGDVSQTYPSAPYAEGAYPPPTGPQATPSVPPPAYGSSQY